MAEESIHDQLNRLGRKFWAIRNGTGGTAITLSFELGGAWSCSLHTLRGLGEWECKCKKLANERGCVKAIIEETIFEGDHFFIYSEAHYSHDGEYCCYNGRKIKTERVP